MKTRKELKKEARKNFKKHIVFFIIVCAIATFIGSEFVWTLILSNSNIEEKGGNILTGINLNELENGKNIDAFGSGSIFLIGLSAFRSIANTWTSPIAIATIIAALVVYFLFWYYIVNIFKVVSSRIFLEGRTYSKVPFRRMVYLSKVKKWNNVCKVMFVKFIYETLWELTIVGGLIKHYSYLMVPYILAENPAIKPNTAITLSRKIMYGHKWEAFKIDLSFIGWGVLGIATYGLSKIAYSDVYKSAVFSEFYVELRSLAKENKIENAELLNDKYLYEFADTKLINEEYKDVLKIMNQEDYIIEKTKGIKFVLFDFFGIHRYTKEETKYEKQKLKEYVIDEYSPVITKNTYPFRLFTLKSKSTTIHRIESLNYLRQYSLLSIIYIFFIISFIGWLWEVVLFLINEGTFINRGMLHGPWIPIYGTGSIFILLFLSKFRKNIPVEFLLAVILCGCVEYFTAWAIETTHGGMRWWDYSDYFLNLHGRICAEGLLTFGFGGLAMVYLIAPAIDNKLRQLNKSMLVIGAAILIALFSVDAIYSHKSPNVGDGINDFKVTDVSLIPKLKNNLIIKTR